MTPPESGILTWKAPMCCVMPPASPAATEVFRSASRSVVLPWSTWPMIVTTGGRTTASLSRSCVLGSSRSSLVPVVPLALNPQRHTLLVWSSSHLDFLGESDCPAECHGDQLRVRERDNVLV